MRRPIKGGRISICVKTSNCATCVSSNIKEKLFREKQVHSRRRMLQPFPTRRFYSNSMLCRAFKHQWIAEASGVSAASKEIEDWAMVSESWVVQVLEEAKWADC